ncbi:hypothetical protein F5Y16DRAFT_398344 [Xylariaceae sp. FL0255]|nr:hypothetical protein F5Y16DRAFT_398344 [Xylariaceae sp. FL0255]
MDDRIKQEIATTLWGLSASQTDLDRLGPYFDYYKNETRHAALLSKKHVQSHKAIMSSLGALKENSNATKEELDSICGNAVVTDLAVRLMLMTSCQTPGTIGGDIFRPLWKSDETLCQYIHRIYPRYDPPSDGSQSQPIYMHKLTADFLKSYVNIDIRWTDRLSDHLLLLKGSDWKSLYLFSHPAFLTTSLEVLPKEAPDGTTETAFAIDSCKLEHTVSYHRRYQITTHLTKVVRERRLDPALLQPLLYPTFEHNSPADALHPVDINGLYKRFPFWAERLHDLWAEANNPTPITYIERLTHRKQSPRFSYWCTVVAIMIGILFGIFATLLGALQVWISYCSWLDDPSVTGCGLKRPS